MRKPLRFVFVAVAVVGCLSALGPTGWARQRQGPSQGVQIRVLNNSDFDFTNLVVNRVQFGDLEKYRASRYQRLDGAYQYGAVSFRVNGKDFRVTPIDFVGETPLRAGQYTYLVSIDYDSGTMDLKFYVGDTIPTGRQAAGRAKIVKTEHAFEVTDVKEAPDRGYVISGQTRRSVFLNPTVSTIPGSRVIYLPNASAHAGSSAAMLLKTDAAGNKTWLQKFGGQTGAPIAKDIWVSPDGGVLFAGQDHYLEKKADGTTAPKVAAWLVRADASGRQQWSQHYGEDAFTRATSVQGAGDGTSVLAGQWNSGTFLLKVDKAGRQLWRRLFPNDDQADFLVRTEDGGYILGGHVYRYYADKNSWIMKTDALGQSLWTHSIQGSAVAASEAPGGGYVVAGNRPDSSGSHHAFLRKVDAMGRQLWERSFVKGRIDYLSGIASAGDGGFVLAGQTYRPASSNRDFWMIRVDSNGQQRWQQIFDHAVDEEAPALLRSADGGYLLAGTTDAGQIWLVKTSSTGMREWDKTIAD
jgi:hypothetical protein